MIFKLQGDTAVTEPLKEQTPKSDWGTETKEVEATEEATEEVAE